MKKNLIFIIFFSVILFTVAFTTQHRVFSQTSTNVCRYNIETRQESTCVSGTACRMVINDCQGGWGCMTPFGCSAPQPNCTSIANCTRWTLENENQNPARSDLEKARESVSMEIEPVSPPPRPHQECIGAPPLPMYCFTSSVVLYQSMLWNEVRYNIEAYNKAVDIYKTAVDNWRLRAEAGHIGPRPIPPDPNDFLLDRNNDSLFPYRVKYESSYGSDPRALTPPLSKDQAFQIFNAEYQDMFNKIAVDHTIYSRRFEPATSTQPRTSSPTPTPTSTQQISLLANGQTSLLAYPGETITYTWRAPSGPGYTYSSTYTSDAPDNCPGGIIRQGEIKPWVANTQQGSTSAVVQQCQAGRTYTITYMVKDSTGTPVVSTSITVRVGTGTRTSTTTVTTPRPTEYNPSRPGFTGATTIPGVTDRPRTTSQTQNQTQQNNLNSLVDSINRINSVLQSISNLDSNTQRSIIELIQRFINSLRDLLTNLINQANQPGGAGGSGGAGIGSGGSSTSTPTSTPTSTTPITSTSTLGQFRYLKIDAIKAASWVAFREIEVYDQNGQKINLVNAKGSSGSWVPQNSGPEKAIDGNPNTAWNAGETNPECMVNYGPSCPNSSRNAWIVVDLGSSKQVSKIRVLEMGDQTSSTLKFYVSNDDRSYNYVGEFSGAVRDNTWIEYPTPQSTPQLSVSLTVNGRKEVEIWPGEIAIIEWSATGTGGTFYSFSLEEDSSLPGYEFTNPVNRSYCGSIVGSQQTFSNFKQGLLPLRGKHLIKISGESGCFYKTKLTFKYKIVDLYNPNRFAEDSIVIKIKGLPRPFNDGVLGEIVRDLDREPNPIAIPLPGRTYYFRLSSNSQYTPSIKVLNAPQDIEVSLGNWYYTRDIYQRPLRAFLPITIKIKENARPGDYIIRFQSENETNSFVDFFIKVVEENRQREYFGSSERLFY